MIQAAPNSGSSSHDGAEADCDDIPCSSEGTSGIAAMRCRKGSGAACLGHDAESAVLVFNVFPLCGSSWPSLATWITRRNVEHVIISLELDGSISAVEAVHFIYQVKRLVICHLLIPSLTSVLCA